ncbi:MAG TPA: SusC/RagA family TonB-linked outer membrane protein [Puia sp.]|nr:SusC/RagA family TonB-linked outer membrane protein [Puia sp.]
MRIFLLFSFFFGVLGGIAPSVAQSPTQRQPAAQPETITGKISNNKGEAVPFATIRIKGSKASIAADVDGAFHLRLTRGQTLVITSAAYQTAEVVVNGTSLDVTLIPKETALTEVVVTALGQSQSKARLGYSTTTFGTAAINKNAPVGMRDGLQGKIAGAEISNTGGPGSSTKVILRGYGVIAGGNNQPLYVIDGVPLSDVQIQNNSSLTNGGNLLSNQQDFGNGMNDVNPNDIESITVLKGTAASSLYGGLAKNGAIMITTKKGHAGKLKIEFNSAVTVSKVGKLPDYQTEFGQGWGGVFVLSENGSWGPRLDGKPRLWGSKVDNSQLIKPFSAVKNGLRDFYETGLETTNNLAISGGTDANRFYFSYGNTNSDGVVPTKSDFLQRNSFALRTNSNYGNFSFNTSFNYINRKLSIPGTGQNGSDGGGIFLNVLQIPVDISIRQFRDYKNKFFNIDNYFTPFSENAYFGLNENGNQQRSDRFFGDLDMGYKISHSLSAVLRIGGDFTNARTLTWKQVASASPGSWNSAGNPEQWTRSEDAGSVTRSADFYGIINGDFILKYNTDLGKDFSLDALAGANYYQVNQQSAASAITNLVIPGFYSLSNTSLAPVVLDQSALRRKMGVYGQVTLSYQNQLFLTGNVRNDWSSTLPIDHNSIFYPGANLSWVASEMLKSRNTISFLKFRAAYGRTGSDAAPYLVYPSLGAGTVNLPFGTLTTPFNGVSGFGISDVIGNTNLKPILVDELEFGTEIKFFHDRLGLDITGYDRKDKGQIFKIPTAPTTGYTNVVENLGVVSNKGIELTLNAVPLQTKDFTWNFVYTFARNWNKVDELTGATKNPLIYGVSGGAGLRSVLGKSVASIYAPVPQKTSDGRVVVDANSGFPMVNATPLDKFGLADGYFGAGIYDYTMGLSNSFAYKSFALSFSLDFRYGGVMFSNTANTVLFDGNGIATTYNDRKPFTLPNSVNASLDAGGKLVYSENKTQIGAGSPALGGHGSGQNDFTFGYYNPAYNAGSGYGLEIFDRSFLKLRDVNISFTLPHAWITRIGASAASIGIFGKNFLLWTPKSNVYVDPEQTNIGNDLAGQLGEFSSGPLSKSYGATLKITF